MSGEVAKEQGNFKYLIYFPPQLLFFTLTQPNLRFSLTRLTLCETMWHLSRKKVITSPLQYCCCFLLEIHPQFGTSNVLTYK